jgi:hypothetical protein
MSVKLHIRRSISNVDNVFLGYLTILCQLQRLLIETVYVQEGPFDICPTQAAGAG